LSPFISPTRYPASAALPLFWPRSGPPPLWKPPGAGLGDVLRGPPGCDKQPRGHASRHLEAGRYLAMVPEVVRNGGRATENPRWGPYENHKKCHGKSR